MITLADLKQAAVRLEERLKQVDMNQLDVSDYVKQYVQSYQQELGAVLQRYVFILHQTLQKINLMDQVSLMDFGGGTGIFTLLAKYVGIAQVTYMDMSDEMAKGAEALAKICDVKVDHFIVGSYESLDHLCFKNFDIIANYDVLEHLYDPVEAFQKLSRYLNPGGCILMASGANTYNPIINRLYRKKHYISENLGTVSGKKIDCKEPFLMVRSKIIKECAPDLPESSVKQLSIATRGKRSEDIINTVEDYIKNRILPELQDATNTCDPITGNGDENLLNVHKLRGELEKKIGYSRIGAGFYPVSKPQWIAAPEIKDPNIIKRLYPYLNYLSKILAPILNVFIYILPLNLKLIIAPYYFIITSNERS